MSRLILRMRDTPRVDGFDYYMRQFRDMKIIPRGKHIAGYLPQFARACGHAIAKSHARSGDPEAIAAYIGSGGAFADGILGFGLAYARQTHDDHRALIAAVSRGEMAAAERAW